MQNNNLTNGLFVALVLASPVVGAGAYPPPFEPQIIYQDSDYISKSKQVTAAAPAAAAPAAAVSSKEAADTTKYPAGFEPVILYQDAEAISKASKAASVATSKSNAAERESVAPAAVESPSGNPLMDNLPLIGVAFLGLGGIMFWSKRSGSGKGAATLSGVVAAAAPVVGGETGVAKYLKSVTGVATETGVSKYLKSLPGAAVSAVETGVSKYLKSLPASVASSAETGVAKYLKKVG